MWMKSSDIVGLWSRSGVVLTEVEKAIAEGNARKAGLLLQRYGILMGRLKEFCVAHHGEPIEVIIPKYLREGWISETI
jgi:hypothetical protein